MNRVLVTGAAGFIGSHLCEEFLNKKYIVFGIDNFITGSIYNMSSFINSDNFTFFEYDICDKQLMEELSDKIGEINYILHFASPASPVVYLKHPIETLDVGSIGTKNILEIARKKKARILVASTSEVYGDPLVHPQTEDYWGNVNPIGPRSVYDEAKRFQESLTMAYHTYYKVDIRIVRIFNTYGPRMSLDDGRVLPAFFSQAIKGEPLTVFGDGSQTRSFCYVDDLVEGIYRLLFSDCHTPVNLGNPQEISIRTFADEINEIVGSNSPIEFKPLPTDDPKQRKPDISKAVELLNWKPVVDRKDGLLKTYEYFKVLCKIEN